MSKNPHKTVCATSRGIIMSFRDSYKHKFVTYDQQSPLYTLQVYGRVKYQEVEKPVFNKVQQQLYAEIVYGLNYFSEEEKTRMSAKKRFGIMHAYKKAQKILNYWKQQLVNKRADNIMQKLFPHSPITKVFIETQGCNSTEVDTHTFKELGITQPMIAERLIAAKLLPADFFKLA